MRRARRTAMLLVSLMACACVVPRGGAASERVSQGRFENLALVRPDGDVRQVVLLLSGDAGWDAGMERLAKTFAAEGALVIGVATPQALASFSNEGGECVYPSGDLENLSHWVQGYAHLPTYYRPVLVGYAEGAGLAYAALTQAGPDVFAGGIAFGFCPHLAMKLPPCDARGRGVGARRAGGVDLVPAEHLAARWTVLHGTADRTCPVAATAAFVAKTSGATLVRLPNVGHANDGRWTAAMLTAYRALAVPTTAAVPPPPNALDDLPLIEVPPTGTDPRFAVLLSGDGGWAGLDKDVAAALAARGIPVVGWDSLRYFWTARTPDRVAADVDRVLRYYADHWQRRHAIVIGYSQGADVLPFALNRLPEATRSLVARMVLIGLGEKASFEFHVGNWLGNDDADALPIRPEAEKLSAATTLCLYGADETDSLCPTLGAVPAAKLPGGHHFDGDYGRLADEILGTPTATSTPIR